MYRSIVYLATVGISIYSRFSQYKIPTTPPERGAPISSYISAEIITAAGNNFWNSRLTNKKRIGYTVAETLSAKIHKKKTPVEQTARVKGHREP